MQQFVSTGQHLYASRCRMTVSVDQQRTSTLLTSLPAPPPAAKDQCDGATVWHEAGPRPRRNLLLQYRSPYI